MSKKKLAPKHRIVGEVVLHALADVKPNDWNPNHMTDFTRDSLRFGLESDGWLIADALLVWGKDEKGKKRDVIIDGEHRWTVATELGFTEGPMVFVNGLTEASAKALTIKMNQKHGEFDRAKLEDVVRSIQGDLSPGDFSLDLGIPEEEMMTLLAEPELVIPDAHVDTKPVAPPGEVEMPSGKMEHVRMQQLFFDEAQHTEFLSHITRLSAKFNTNTVTDTIVETFRAARTAHPAS